MGTKNDWQSTTIGDLLKCYGGNIKTGPFGTILKAKEYSKEGVPLISVGEIQGGSFKIQNSTKKVPREVVDRLPEYVLEEGDIVLGRKGAVDRSAFVKLAQAGWFLGSDGIRLRPPKSCNARFLAYHFQSPSTKSWLLQHAPGTIMPSLNQRVLEHAPILLPPLSEQRAIAHILGTLDDKIELNRRMNETLEAMARAIFKSWFVDFDPVRAKMEGRPTGLPKEIEDLFPDSFGDSELGKIPRGWRVKKISELASNIQYGLTQSGSQDPIGPHFLRITDIQGGHVNWKNVPYCKVTPLEYEKYCLKPNDILVARTGASTGENIFLPNPPQAVFASYLVRFQFIDKSTARFIGSFMRSAFYFDYVLGNLGGSAQPNASAQVLAGAELITPPIPLMDQFSSTISSFDTFLSLKNNNSNILSGIRDYLLPKLLSGDISVEQPFGHNL